MRISDVPNQTNIDRIQAIGVRQIDLNVNSYLQSLLPTTFRPSIFDAIFGIPDGQAGVLKRANTIGALSLKRGKFKKDEVRRDEWLTRVGEAVVQEGGASFTITLEDHSKISTDTLKVTRQVRLRTFANSVDIDEAKIALAVYYDELSANGSLEW